MNFINVYEKKDYEYYMFQAINNYKLPESRRRICGEIMACKYSKSKDLAMIFASQCVENLKYFDISIREDLDVMKVALENKDFKVSVPFTKYGNDKKYILEQDYYFNLAELSVEMCSDMDVVMRSLLGYQNELDLKSISCELMQNRKVAIAMILSNDCAIQILKDARILNPLVVEIDYDIAMIAIRKDGTAIKYLPELAHNRELALVAVVNSYEILSYMPQFADDEEIVSAAINASIRALNYVGSKLRNNIAFMSSVLFHYPGAIIYAGAAILECVDLVRAVVMERPALIEYLSARERTHPKMLYVILSGNHDYVFIVSNELRPRGYSVMSVLVCLRLA